MKSKKRFVVGAMVKWVSQAQGVAKEKIGLVVEVVAAGGRPNRVAFPDLHKGGCGFARDHESYVVRVDVGKTPGRSMRHYWPRVSALESVQDAKGAAGQDIAAAGPA